MDKGRLARNQGALEGSNSATGDREEDETDRAGASAEGGNFRHRPGTLPLTLRRRGALTCSERGPSCRASTGINADAPLVVDLGLKAILSRLQDYGLNGCPRFLLRACRSQRRNRRFWAVRPRSDRHRLLVVRVSFSLADLIGERTPDFSHLDEIAAIPFIGRFGQLQALKCVFSVLCDPVHVLCEECG